VGQGLAMPAITGGGLLIGFATAPGDTAADGDGRNSPFTTAMLKHINTPGLEIQSLMTRVKSDVYAATKEEQQPWHNSSLRTEYYMVPLEKTDAAPQIASTVDAEWNQVKETTSLAALDAFMAAHADKPMFMALAQERKDQLAKKNTSEVLDSLKIPERPVVKSQILKELVLNLPQDEAQPSVQKRSESDWTLAKFFDLGKTANDGGTKFALLSVPNVKLPRPGKNAGKKLGAFNMTEVASAQTLDLLLSSNTDITFSEEASTTCRLDWIDRCPFIPKPLIEMMGAAMLKNSMRIKDQLGPYFNISRLAGTENYILSNNPAFGNGDVAIVAAIVTPAGEVMDMFGFDLSRDRIGVETGDVASNVGLTWAAVEGDDIYVSFDSSYRCTDTPRKFGFITKFGMAERDVKWVSAFNVSDVNFVVLDSTLISANGGSCVDDFAYKISKDTGVIEARFKTPKAIERMDYNNGNLVLQLYEGAGVFQLP
jgi:hypothetical protein